MTFETLRVEQSNGVATVTINREQVLNAINRATLQDLDDCLTNLQSDSSVRVVVLTGAGNRAFIAGADISELAEMTPTSGHAIARRGQALCERIERSTVPFIAAVNGFALGGGLELAMACTFRIAADTATFGQPEVNLGLIPGFGGTQRLPRLIGPALALEMLLTGKSIDAGDAGRVGLVNRVVAAEKFLDEVGDLARLLASKPPVAVKYILEAVRTGMQISLPEARELEATLFGLVAATEDMREGTQAFLEKRAAVFKGQ